MSVRLNPDQFLTSQRVIICCGSGGVGKTTTAAALGLRAAQLGRDVLVMTIDPARRLAQALGLATLSHEPQPIQLAADGQLAAMMLDPRSAFDRLVAKHAPDAAARQSILDNRYYQQLAENFGGSRELISMELVLEQAKTAPDRLLIVDTPPAQHALDFLDAPRRVLGLLDGTLTDALLRPYRGIARAQFNLFRQSSTLTLKFIEGLTGSTLVSELGEFLNSFSVLFDGFRDRAKETRALMQRADTGFLLVCAPDPLSLREVNRFATRLAAEELTALGVLVNRVSTAMANDRTDSPVSQSPQDTVAAQLVALREAGSSEGLQSAMEPLLVAVAHRQQLERQSLHSYLGEDANSRMQNLPNLCVPEFASDLHSIEDLARYAAAWQTARSF